MALYRQQQDIKDIKTVKTTFSSNFAALLQQDPSNLKHTKITLSERALLGQQPDTSDKEFRAARRSLATFDD